MNDTRTLHQCLGHKHVATLAEARQCRRAVEKFVGRPQQIKEHCSRTMPNRDPECSYTVVPRPTIKPQPPLQACRMGTLFRQDTLREIQHAFTCAKRMEKKYDIPLTLVDRCNEQNIDFGGRGQCYLQAHPFPYRPESSPDSAGSNTIAADQ